MLIEDKKLECYYVVSHKETGRTAMSHYRELRDAQEQFAYWIRVGKVPYIDKIEITRKITRIFDMDQEEWS
jgi:hypothetical protein